MQFLVEAALVQRVEGGGPIIPLTSANLSDANLRDAHLINAHLNGAHGVTKEGLEQQASSLEGTIMPDGTINAGRYATREFEPALSFTLSDDWQDRVEMTEAIFVEGSEGGQLIFTRPLWVFAPRNPSERKEVAKWGSERSRHADKHEQVGEV